MWSPPQPESDFCPEKAVDLNGDLFSGRYAYRVYLSLRTESHCQLPIAEVYSDKAAADVRLYSYWTICSKSENHRHITSNQHQVDAVNIHRKLSYRQDATHLLQVGIRERGSHPDFKGPVF